MKRRNFLKNTAILGSSIAVGSAAISWTNLVSAGMLQGKKIGMIGLDTSHSIEFTRVLNTAPVDSPYRGYRVTAAYPYGSRSIPSSYERIPANIEKIKNYQVNICSSLEALLSQVDVVLLETNDGHLHLEQAEKVFQPGKLVFIDKPLGANLKQVKELYLRSAKYGIPFFTSSALRYIPSITQVRDDKKCGKVLAASTFSPCTIEPSHEDLYWYGIHGVEMLFAVMGVGCKTVQAIHTADTDMAVGIWEDGRVGSFRGSRSGVNAFGGTVFGEKCNIPLGDYEGYENLLLNIVDFFESGKLPVPIQETKEIYAFMSAYQKSKQKQGKPVLLEHF